MNKTQNIRRCGFFDVTQNDKRNGVFIIIKDNNEKIAFAKDGIEIEYDIQLVLSVIENFSKSTIDYSKFQWIEEKK